MIIYSDEGPLSGSDRMLDLLLCLAAQVSATTQKISTESRFARYCCGWIYDHYSHTFNIAGVRRTSHMCEVVACARPCGKQNIVEMVHRRNISVRKCALCHSLNLCFCLFPYF